MCVLDTLVKYFPVADVPEMIIRLYLAGDDCLDGDDETLDAVFTKVYTGEYMTTCLDTDCKIAHSFNDQNCRSYLNEEYWYRNGKRGRKGNKPAIITSRFKLWYYCGKKVMYCSFGVCDWYDKNGNLVLQTKLHNENIQEQVENIQKQVDKWILKCC